MQHTLLAFQVFLGLPEAQSLHQTLQRFIAAAPPQQGFAGKNAYYKQLADLLRPWAGRFERGVWDYVETHAEAEEEWTQWTQGTVADAIEPKQNRGPYRGSREHMFVSVLLLLVKGGSSDAFICERCRIPDESMWKRATFMYLLDGISMLNFSTVRGDAIYVRPGLSAGAVSEEELGEDHYDYLRTLTA